ncbi:lipopolysaccharide biosynthesis protein [Planococcus sp. YIM B11945]|uniref:lipopolysaccharide biosynthesis protein n=1 Tax=Planococcus sp. YIM B11945 TaxID=3435410 RepID=UPI003D7CA595
MVSQIEKLVNKPFIKNVVIVMTGTASAQIISMLASPIITRLYGPEAFGIMGTFIAIMGLFTPVAALTYSNAIVLPKSDADAKALIRLSIGISVIYAFVLTVLLLVFNDRIVSLFKMEEMGAFIYLLPIVIIFAGLTQIAEQWLIRTKQFKITAKVTFLQVLINQGSKIGIGFFVPIAAVLIFLTAINDGMKAFMMIGFAKKSAYEPNYGENESYTSVLSVAKEHLDFPLFRAPQSLINAVSQSLPILLLSSFFGPVAAGFFALGRTVLFFPSHIIGKSVGDVFYPRIADAAKNEESLSFLIKKATIALALIGTIPFGTVIILGPWLFSLVFGADWGMAGEYARWIAFWSFTNFINRPSVVALPVLSAQAFHLGYTVFMLAVWSTSMATGYYVFLNDVTAVAFWGVTGSLLNLGLILITARISKKYDAKKSMKNE